MPRKNFYISDADEKDVYQKAKDLAGDSISSVIVDALRQYVYSREAAAKEMDPIIIYEGQIDHRHNVSTGTNLRFTGKELATYKPGTDELDLVVVYKLYYTLKGKFLVWKGSFNRDSEIEICTRSKAYDSFREVSEGGYPGELISQAVKQMPDVACEELDI
ncbi:MAG TPA: hypothetical protein VN642_07300 [Dongiaceae bacterium]|nr:hypothetical protein [Dongiaceae bacterium]